MKARIRIYNPSRRKILDTERVFSNDGSANSWACARARGMEKAKRVRVDRIPINYSGRTDLIEGKSEKILDEIFQDEDPEEEETPEEDPEEEETPEEDPEEEE